MANSFRQFRLLVWKNFILQVGRAPVVEVGTLEEETKRHKQNLSRLEQNILQSDLSLFLYFLTVPPACWNCT